MFQPPEVGTESMGSNHTAIHRCSEAAFMRNKSPFKVDGWELWDIAASSLPCLWTRRCKAVPSVGPADVLNVCRAVNTSSHLRWGSLARPALGGHTCNSQPRCSELGSGLAACQREGSTLGPSPLLGGRPQGTESK